MTMQTEQERFWIFAVVWGIYGLASWWFYKNASVSEKRKWHPWFIFGSSALFIVGTYFIMESVRILLFAIPLVIAISWWNYKKTRFCDGCGAMLMPTGWGDKVNTCGWCEAKVKTSLGSKVADMRQRKQIFVGAAIIFAGSIFYQLISSQGVLPFLPTLSSDESSLLISIALVAFAVGVLACRCPNCGKFLTGGDGVTPFVPECPGCHVPFK